MHLHAYENLTSKLWGLLTVCLSFFLTFFCHLVLHVFVISVCAVIFLSFGFAFHCHIFVIWLCIVFVMFFSFSCRFLVRRGWLDPEPTWKIQKRDFASMGVFFCHLFRMFFAFVSHLFAFACIVFCSVFAFVLYLSDLESFCLHLFCICSHVQALFKHFVCISQTKMTIKCKTKWQKNDSAKQKWQTNAKTN